MTWGFRPGRRRYWVARLLRREAGEPGLLQDQARLPQGEVGPLVGEAGAQQGQAARPRPLGERGGAPDQVSRGPEGQEARPPQGEVGPLGEVGGQQG